MISNVWFKCKLFIAKKYLKLSPYNNIYKKLQRYYKFMLFWCTILFKMFKNRSCIYCWLETAIKVLHATYKEKNDLVILPFILLMFLVAEPKYISFIIIDWLNDTINLSSDKFFCCKNTAFHSAWMELKIQHDLNKDKNQNIHYLDTQNVDVASYFDHCFLLISDVRFRLISIFFTMITNIFCNKCILIIIIISTTNYIFC